MALSHPPYGHNHEACVAQAMATAEQVCRQRGARLTALRRRVLELVWRSHQPVLAYDLLALLANDGRRGAPPTVYRALDFLMAHGLVHRVESLNAFVGCTMADAEHSGQLLICQCCRTVSEMHDPEITALIRERSRAHGYEPARQTVEVHGSCRSCADAQKSSSV